MFLLNFKITYQNAPVHIREDFSFSKKQRNDLMRKICNETGVKGCVIINTCNRTEIYAAAERGESIESIILILKDINHNVENYLEVSTGTEVIRHLFRVASGLESLIIGEDQILAQVKNNYFECKNQCATDSLLDLIFNQAIKVGKLVRTKTDISKGGVSVGSAAVALAEHIFGSLNDKKILIVGAGEMSCLIAKSLSSKGLNGVYVSNRNYETAKNIAETIGGQALKFDYLIDHIKSSDLVITATSAPHTIIHEKDIREITKERKNDLVIIDIAIPKDVEDSVGLIDGVHLYNIDSLSEIAKENMELRREEAEKASIIVEDELKKFDVLLKGMFIEPYVADVWQKAEEIRKKELDRALKMLNLTTEKEIKILEDLTRSIVSKILHKPVRELRDKVYNNLEAIESFQK
ncbi:MAG: Glutamyl-tRNA reductase [Candidatus Methanofastidiosum methylothiophilum]|uniref:Glutamyl-tRNA reductase n=1 Tax=Candidatus Methanofastidiosum methylothiophilum TaxID=1705564 RepID=A0A150J5Q1_9EURY|nr:MAG: Glutamyl-tRNA reductase [Candidatus Methanofastidiosum methylthiophilus]NMC77166.1 glutamyl-tRNA reductase [Candidatus Methanofastidiosa archaeon]